MLERLSLQLYALHARMRRGPEVHHYQNGGSVNMSVFIYVKYLKSGAGCMTEDR